MKKRTRWMAAVLVVLVVFSTTQYVWAEEKMMDAGCGAVSEAPNEEFSSGEVFRNDELPQDTDNEAVEEDAEDTAGDFEIRKETVSDSTTSEGKNLSEGDISEPEDEAFAELAGISEGWKEENGNTYYYNSDGTKYTGWLKWKSRWYYLDPNADGMMLTGFFVVDGKEYYAREESGYWYGSREYNEVWRKDGIIFHADSEGIVTRYPYSYTSPLLTVSLTDNIICCYDEETAELTISGEGEWLAEYSSWCSLSDIIQENAEEHGLKKVIIGDGVKNIPDNAFYGVRFGSYYEEGDDYGFDLIIGQSVESIGNEAFCCSNVRSISVSEGLKRIGDSAFLGTSLNGEVILPESLEELGSRCFGMLCSDKPITIRIPAAIAGKEDFVLHALTDRADFESEYYPDIVLTFSDDTKSIGTGFCLFDGMTEIIFPDGLERIGYYAHMCLMGENYLKKITIPSTVSHIGSCAFSGAPILDSIVFKGTWQEWHDKAFYDSSRWWLSGYCARVNDAETAQYADPFKTATIEFDRLMPDESTVDKWVRKGGAWYGQRNGRPLSGVVAYKDELYYLDQNGKELTGWQQIDGKWHYFDDAMRFGWQKIGGHWFYFSPSSGVMVSNCVLAIDGKDYAFDKNGALVIDKWVKVEINDKDRGGYDVSESMWFHTNKQGVIRKSSWINTSGGWYYTQEDGTMVDDCTITINGKEYAFDGTGRLVG